MSCDACHLDIPFPPDSFMTRIKQQARENRIPITGGVELTHRCNLQCQHCYLGRQSAICDRAPRGEMATATILKIIDDITAAGCLHLLLTGGEIFMRKDFAAIYSHAIKNGLIVELFTNGTLIADEHIELLRTYTPRKIEITLYGATAVVYESMTQVKGSYAKCMRGIERLLANNLFLALKAAVTKLNLFELVAMEKMAKSFGTKFRYDYYIQPCWFGDSAPTALRISPEEAVRLDFADPKHKQDAKDIFMRGFSPRSNNKIYNCGMGRLSFHVDPYGFMTPCILARHYKYDLLAGSFVDGWKNFFPPIHEKILDPNSACAQCKVRLFCKVCPSLRQLENGSENQPCAYACRIAQLKTKLLSEECT